MNKAFSIALVFLLTTSVVGVSVNTHYCGGSARYSALATDADHTACCGDEMDACPSCEDQLSSNVMDEQSVFTSPPVLLPLTAGLAIFPVDTEQGTTSDLHLAAVTPISHGPPGKYAGSTIPILYQTFLI